jgi:hypothetical protein
MRFENLDPWPEAVPLIELEYQGSTLDLHNWGEFVGFSFETPDSLSLSGRRHKFGLIRERDSPPGVELLR